jgi:hypothetical protein
MRPRIRRQTRLLRWPIQWGARLVRRRTRLLRRRTRLLRRAMRRPGLLWPRDVTNGWIRRAAVAELASR